MLIHALDIPYHMYMFFIRMDTCQVKHSGRLDGPYHPWHQVMPFSWPAAVILYICRKLRPCNIFGGSYNPAPAIQDLRCV